MTAHDAARPGAPTPSPTIDPAVADLTTLRVGLARDDQTPLGPGVKGFTGLGADSPEGLVGTAVLDSLTGPFAVLRERELDGNIATMADYCAEHHMVLAPHVKTTMSPQIFARQLRAGAWALTAAHIGQVEVYRSYGVRRILLANQLVDPIGVDYLASQLARDPLFRPYLWVDSEAGVDLLDDRLRAVGLGRRVDVLVELGVPGGRTGVRGSDAAIGLARYAASKESLRVAGVTGFEGSAASDAEPASLAAVRDYCRELRTVGEAVAAEFGGTDDRMIVSAGGSSYFDIVAEECAGLDDAGIRVVLRSGSYVIHDNGHIDELSPYHRGTGPEFAAALEVWAHVVSRPEPGLALVCAGKRDLAYDIDLPTVTKVRRRADRAVVAADGITLTGLNDQHAFLSVTGDVELAVGDLVALGISHPCTALDKWRALAVVDPDYRLTGVAHARF